MLVLFTKTQTKRICGRIIELLAKENRVNSNKMVPQTRSYSKNIQLKGALMSLSRTRDVAKFNGKF